MMSLLFTLSPRMSLQHNFPNKTTGEMIDTPAVTSIDNYEYTDATKEGGQPQQTGGRVVLNSPHPELPPQLPVIYAGELAWVTRAAAPPATASPATASPITAPPTLPFDTATQFRAAVHQHSASPLCTDPACTYYNGTRAVDVAGQRRHDVGISTLGGSGAFYQDVLWLCMGSASNSTPVQAVYTNTSSPPCVSRAPTMGFCADPGPELTVPEGAVYIGLERGVNGVDCHHWSFYYAPFASDAEAWTAAAPELGNALIRFTGARVTTDYSDVAAGTPPDTFFQPPSQCAPASMATATVPHVTDQAVYPGRTATTAASSAPSNGGGNNAAWTAPPGTWISEFSGKMNVPSPPKVFYSGHPLFLWPGLDPTGQATGLFQPVLTLGQGGNTRAKPWTMADWFSRCGPHDAAKYCHDTYVKEKTR